MSLWTRSGIGEGALFGLALASRAKQVREGPERASRRSQSPAQGARLFEGALNRGADPDHPRPGVGPEHRADLGDAEGSTAENRPARLYKLLGGLGVADVVHQTRRRAVGVNAPSPGPLRRSKGEACSGSRGSRLSLPPVVQTSCWKQEQTMRRPVHPPGGGRGQRDHAWSDARGEHRGLVGNVRWVDEGLPIAYEVLDEGVPVYASDGEQVGTVDHVISAPAEDIFHGIVMRAEGGRRFVAADQVASLHEHGVDLRIDAAAAAALPEPEGGAAALRLREPGVKPSRWTHILDRVSGKDSRQRDWTEED